MNPRCVLCSKIVVEIEAKIPGNIRLTLSFMPSPTEHLVAIEPNVKLDCIVSVRVRCRCANEHDARVVEARRCTVQFVLAMRCMQMAFMIGSLSGIHMLIIQLM